jgi:hypothetical protein
MLRHLSKSTHFWDVSRLRPFVLVNRLWRIGEMILTGENRVWSIGGMILKGENRVWSIGEMILTGENRVWSIGGMILTGENRVWSIGGMILTGESYSTRSNTCLCCMLSITNRQTWHRIRNFTLTHRRLTASAMTRPIVVRFPTGAKDYSLLQNAHTDSGVRPASYLTGTAVLSWDKAAGAGSWPLNHNSVLRL